MPLAVCYLLWLTWLFFGVAVVSDVFVDAITVITSKTKIVKKKTAKGDIIEVEVPVWNWVVANISLMALGTSSPEIMLAVIETIMALGKPTEELGASTIIGSSAYNLFVITAVCTIALKDGQFKRLDHIKVFTWTTLWMLWAHIWIWVVYKKISRGEVELWEAFTTLGFFPVFVQTSYMVDVRGWNWFIPRNEVWPVDEEDGEKSMGEAPAATGNPLPPEVQKHQQMHSILYYRQQAVHQMKGGGTLGSAKDMTHHPDPDAVMDFEVDQLASDDKTVAKVMFKSPQCSCLESAGTVSIQIMRVHGDMSKALEVHFKTEDDTAVAGLDYEPTEGVLKFAADETVKGVEVKLLDDEMSEPDVSFYLTITHAVDEVGANVVVLQKKCLVNIVDDEAGGILSFELPSIEASMCGGKANVVVVRHNGTDSVATVKYSTKCGSAAQGLDYEETSGMLVFNAQETKKTISVPVVEKHELDPQASLAKFTHKVFKVVLQEPTSGAQLGARRECRVILVPGPVKGSNKGGGDGSKASKSPKNGKDGEVDITVDYGAGDGAGEERLGTLWAAQFRDAIMPEFEKGDGTIITCALHYMNITWKLLSAVMPPPTWKGGYPTFFSTLAMLAGLMALVKEVAGMFGCSVGLSEVMTGVSIVALGTSLPDTYASRMAAINDSNADAAIGNVMGSNTCNIFLGLGIPWVIATVYYRTKGEIYPVTSGSLGFSVIIFFAGAIVTLVILMWRRRVGGELGGTKSGQWVVFWMLIALWLMFLIIGVLKVVLEAVSYKKEVIVVAVHGYEYAEMSIQLWEDFKGLGMEDYCNNVWIMVPELSCIWDTSLVHRLAFFTEDTLLMHLRLRFFARAARLGYNVLNLDRYTLYSCVPGDADKDSSWAKAAGSNVSRKEALSLQESSFRCHTLKAEVVPAPHWDNHFTMMHVGEIRVPNTNDETFEPGYGGRFYPASKGKYFQVFYDQMADDCPE
eukprot:gene611-2040_t